MAIFKSTNVHQLIEQNMSINSGFTVTLPSNSSMAKHPKNTGSLYTVALATPLNFSGQTLNDDTRWEAAMLRLHYTHNFFNFREDCMIHFVMDKPAVAQTAPAEPMSTKIVATGESDIDLNEVMIDERITHWVAERHLAGGVAGKELVGSFEIHKQYYPTLLSLCEDIVAKFEGIFFLHYKLRLVVKINPNGCVSFALANGGKLTMYTHTPYIAKTLGLKATALTPPGTSEAPTIVVYKMATVGTDAPELQRVHALHVQANIVEPQHVGDAMVPLVGYVDITGKPGDRVCHTCNPPIYLRVDTSYINAIEVRITDEQGQIVMFPNNIENVVLRLHFRKKVGVSLFKVK